MSLANDSSPLSPPRERIPRRPTQGCQRCSMKKSRRKKSNNMRSARPRVFCDIAGCASSFCRFSDLARHKKTLHGPKQQCAYHGCQYATGREDKMNEHVRKIHKSAGKTIFLKLHTFSCLICWIRRFSGRHIPKQPTQQRQLLPYSGPP
jgi:hypothetical protein